MATPKLIKSLSRNNYSRIFISWLATKYINWVDKTTSWNHEYTQATKDYLNSGKPFIGCFWHGRLMMMGSNWNKKLKVFMLISRHPDGKLISQIVARLGYFVLEGSTKREGFRATRQMLKVLKDGNIVGITPDGPRGPLMTASMGAISLAKISGKPILPTTYSVSRKKTINSWDKFLFALFFGEGIFLWADPIWVPNDADDQTMEKLRIRLQNSLIEITKRADEICGTDQD